MDDQRKPVGEQHYPMEDAPVTPSNPPMAQPAGGVSPTWPGAPDPAVEAARYERARKRVRQLRAFYASLSSYLTVNLILFLINLFTAPGEWWFLWVAVFWGIGIVAQGWSVFGPRFDQDWEERKIQEELRKRP